jgi:hypothetical protein
LGGSSSGGGGGGGGGVGSGGGSDDTSSGGGTQAYQFCGSDNGGNGGSGGGGRALAFQFSSSAAFEFTAGSASATLGADPATAQVIAADETATFAFPSAAVPSDVWSWLLEFCCCADLLVVKQCSRELCTAAALPFARLFCLAACSVFTSSTPILRMLCGGNAAGRRDVRSKPTVVRNLLCEQAVPLAALLVQSSDARVHLHAMDATCGLLAKSGCKMKVCKALCRQPALLRRFVELVQCEGPDLQKSAAKVLLLITDVRPRFSAGPLCAAGALKLVGVFLGVSKWPGKQQFAIRLMARISVVSVQLRDAVLDGGLLVTLLQVLQGHCSGGGGGGGGGSDDGDHEDHATQHLNVMRHGAKALAALVCPLDDDDRGNETPPLPPGVLREPQLLPAVRALLASADDEIISSACDILLCMGFSPGGAVLLGRLDARQRTVQLLEHRLPSVRDAALRTALIEMRHRVGEWGGYTFPGVDALVDAGAVPPLAALLRDAQDGADNDYHAGVRHGTCQALARITAGGCEAHVQAVLDAGAVPPLLREARLANILGPEDTATCRYGATAITNVVLGGTTQQASSLATPLCVGALVRLLSWNDTHVIVRVLHALTALLHANDEVASVIGASDGLRFIDALLTHRIHEFEGVYEQARQLRAAVAPENEDDDGAAAGTGSQSSFNLEGLFGELELG